MPLALHELMAIKHRRREVVPETVVSGAEALSYCNGVRNSLVRGLVNLDEVEKFSAGGWRAGFSLMNARFEILWRPGYYDLYWEAKGEAIDIAFRCRFHPQATRISKEFRSSDGQIVSPFFPLAKWIVETMLPMVAVQKLN